MAAIVPDDGRVRKRVRAGAWLAVWLLTLAIQLVNAPTGGTQIALVAVGLGAWFAFLLASGFFERPR